MKPILVINDHSPQAEHAARMALLMAQHLHVDLMLANCHACEEELLERTVAGGIHKDTGYHHHQNELRDELYRLNYSSAGSKSQIGSVNLPGAGEATLVGFAVDNQVGMIVRGVVPGTGPIQNHFSSGSLLKKINCPLLLVPQLWPLKRFERIYYMTDLRNCRLEVVNYLVWLAAPWSAEVSIALLCGDGLEEMEEHYARRLFEQQLRLHVSYPQLSFTSLRGYDVRLAVGVFTQIMNADMLVLAKNSFHFQEVMNECAKDELPVNLPVPLLVFP